MSPSPYKGFVEGSIFIVFVTWALVVYLICTPSALGPVALVLRGVHIRQTTCAHVTNTKCNYFNYKSLGSLTILNQFSLIEQSASFCGCYIKESNTNPLDP